MYALDMSAPLVRLAPVRLWIGDTGPLMQEIVQAVSRAALTSVLASLEHDTARLYVARHVLAEVDWDLPDYAENRGVEPAHALATWRALYLPRVVVVDVQAEWGRLDDRVGQVAVRHPVDLPTAQLAVTLAPCRALVDDADLADHGIGNRRDPGLGVSKWLVLAHGSTNQAQVDMASGAVSVLARLPDWAKVTLVVAAGALLCWWQAGAVHRHHLAAFVCKSEAAEPAVQRDPPKITPADREVQDGLHIRELVAHIDNGSVYRVVIESLRVDANRSYGCAFCEIRMMLAEMRTRLQTVRGLTFAISKIPIYHVRSSAHWCPILANPGRMVYNRARHIPMPRYDHSIQGRK